MSGPIVECAGVSKRFGSVMAVDDVSFALQPGEILSILGPSGSGKTTMLRLIAGFDSPDSGEIRVRGRPVSGRSVHVPADKRNVGMLFQEYALFPHMTVAQNASFGIARLPKVERRGRLAEVLELVRLAGLEDRYPHELSGGQQQRVALARTLAPRPVTVLLDEPFSNLDVGMRREMRQEVQAILRENTIAAVFVTHDREEAFAMADRIGIMNSGHLDQLDTPDVVYHVPATPFVARLAATCDFLKGEAHRGEAVTELGNFPYSSSDGAMPEGAQLELLVHLDDFRVVPDARGKSVIRSREFRGDETVLIVGMPSGATLRCRQHSYSAPAIGTSVTLILENAMLFVAFKR